MATTTATAPAVIRVLPGRQYDHRFFTGTAIAMIISVFIGFAHSYYLAGVFSAPLPSAIIHIHGAVFSGWLFLVIAQTSLVAAGRVDLHRRLGIASMIYAAIMVPLGLVAATDSLVRANSPVPGRDPRAFFIVPTTEILVFGILMGLAFYYRKVAATHKRLIYVANIALLLAAIARWPVQGIYRNNPAAALVSNVFLVALVAYDYWSTRKVYRATIYASLLLMFVQQARAPFSRTDLWISFASWVQHAARGVL
jgi:hypothetical protein